MTTRGSTMSRATRMLVTLFACSLVTPAYASGEPLPSIQLHAIVEAPMQRVWEIVSTDDDVRTWLFPRVERWSPREGGDFRVAAAGMPAVDGRFTAFKVKEGFALDWPGPGTSLAIELRSLDEHLTMVTLVHAGWPEDSPDARHARADAEGRWIVALMKLHRRFPPPLVDTVMHRPRVEGLFVERSLIVNGDFGCTLPSRFDGIAYGWEPNAGKASPEVHAIDDTLGQLRPPCQRIAHPPDWTHFAVQQFTPQIEPLITPGKRYRLTGWVRAEGITNPSGWYKLGLWFTDRDGQPIGEAYKNDKGWPTSSGGGGAIGAADHGPTSKDAGHPANRDPASEDAGRPGSPRLNYDWHRFTIEADAPPGASRAVVILSGHWDAGGTVWYDDVSLWEPERPTTAGR